MFNFSQILSCSLYISAAGKVLSITSCHVPTTQEVLIAYNSLSWVILLGYIVIQPSRKLSHDSLTWCTLCYLHCLLQPHWMMSEPFWPVLLPARLSMDRSFPLFSLMISLVDFVPEILGRKKERKNKQDLLPIITQELLQSSLSKKHHPPILLWLATPIFQCNTWTHLSKT